jgi:hypothetical protein
MKSGEIAPGRQCRGPPCHLRAHAALGNPPEVGAFVQVYVEERANSTEALSWHKVFSGWLFKNSPSLNVVEHPCL